ncbi:MAG: ATP-binding protein [Filomicrobium sp.]
MTQKQGGDTIAPPKAKAKATRTASKSKSRKKTAKAPESTAATAAKPKASGRGKKAVRSSSATKPPSKSANENVPTGEPLNDAVSSGAKGAKSAGVALANNSAFLHEHLLNALPHPVVVLGPSNKFVYANGAAEAFLSTSVSILKRVALDDVLAFGCPLLALVKQLRRNRTTVNEYGVEIVTPRFTAPRLVDVYGGPFPDVPDHVVLMLQQRTMAQMIERQLTHRAAARSVSGMAGILAHEIKNPLSGIRGAAQLLEPSLSDEDRGLSQLICAETERIRALLDRMEVFGDERPLTTTAVNIHDVLDHVQQLAMAGFAREITFVADYDPSLPAVPANRDKLVQAFLNLVKNAAEAIGDRENGRIVMTTSFRPGVRLSVPGSGVRIALPLMIEIQDNGPGVPEEIREHMFDPFVTSKSNGTGLGLALVAKLIADHGGTIECDSEPERTIFRVLLPMQDVTSGKSDPSLAL